MPSHLPRNHDERRNRQPHRLGEKLGANVCTKAEQNEHGMMLCDGYEIGSNPGAVCALCLWLRKYAARWRSISINIIPHMYWIRTHMINNIIATIEGNTKHSTNKHSTHTKTPNSQWRPLAKLARIGWTRKYEINKSFVNTKKWVPA